MTPAAWIVALPAMPGHYRLCTGRGTADKDQSDVVVDMERGVPMVVSTAAFSIPGPRPCVSFDGAEWLAPIAG
jgi:hypothetical protein